jgi:hypothetical protein
MNAVESIQRVRNCGSAGVSAAELMTRFQRCEVWNITDVADGADDLVAIP